MKQSEIVRLFDTYADDLYRFAVSYVASGQEAEDIVQDTFMKLMNGKLSFKKEYEKAYLFKITANMCKDYLKSKRYKSNVDYETLEDYLGETEACAEDEHRLFDAFMQLPEIQRVPLYLHFYEGYTYKEIADILKISESAVAMRISRGKDALKRGLEE